MMALPSKAVVPACVVVASSFSVLASEGDGKLCNNGEGGMGECFARVMGDVEGSGFKSISASFGPRGREEAIKAALTACQLSEDANPSLVSFRDDLSYKDEKGTEYVVIVDDIEDYYFKCPEPAKDTQ